MTPQPLILGTSLKDSCPRCHSPMQPTLIEDFRQWECASCQYAVKEVSGELKGRYAERVRVSSYQGVRLWSAE